MWLVLSVHMEKSVSDCTRKMTFGGRSGVPTTAQWSVLVNPSTDLNSQVRGL